MRRICLAALLVLLLLLHAIAHGNPDELRRQVENTRQEISELEKVVKALDESIKSLVSRIESLEGEHLAVEAEIRAVEGELALAEVRLSEKRRLFAGRVRSAYMSGQMSYFRLILEAENFGDMIVRFAYLARILRRDAELVSAFKAERASYQERKARLDELRASFQDIRYQLEAERRNLADQRREQEMLLSAARKKLEGELALITPRAERKPVYGIAIDNAPQARPQHGLARASLVYEYEVEGRITRYLALFSTFPAKVGPIRSARSHSTMLALENGVNFIYASAGVDVLALIRDWGGKNTNALYYPSASFYRDNSRKAPHNLYVNLSTLGLEDQSQEVLIRPAYLAREGTPATEFTIDYSQNYSVSYEYVPARADYRRKINGQVHRDASGEEIRVRNVIVQYVPHGIDLMGRPTPNIIGEGPIDYYAQGQHFRGTWKKKDIHSPTRFYYQDGQEIERVFGLTWIQLARPR